MRVSRQRREETRRCLLASAARHFAAHGLERASIDAISTEAGFAKGTVYNYFPSKEALFEAVLEDACRRAVRSFAAAGAGPGFRRRLRALAAADLEVFREEEPFMKVMVREAFSFRPRTWSLVMAGLQPFLSAVEDVLQAGRDAGELRRDRPADELALLFVGELALLYARHWTSGRPPLEEIPDLVVSFFLDGAGAARRGARSK